MNAAARRALLMEIGEMVITRIAVQKDKGLAMACLTPEQKVVADWMVDRGVLNKTREEGVVFLRLLQNVRAVFTLN